MSEQQNAVALHQPGQMARWTMVDLSRFAKQVADSSFCPQSFKGKPGDVLVAMQYGIEVGLAPMAAIQNIAVINGRPAVWGDAMLALAQAHPRFVSISEHVDDKTMTARCEVVRKGMPPVVRTFSQADAQAAGLWGKQGPWKQYPKRMLQMRARSFALRDAFADALKGIIAAEEAGDIIDITPAAGLPSDEFEALVKDMESAFERGEGKSWWVGNQEARELCSVDQRARLAAAAKEAAEATGQTTKQAGGGSAATSGVSPGAQATPPASPEQPAGDGAPEGAGDVGPSNSDPDASPAGAPEETEDFAKAKAALEEAVRAGQTDAFWDSVQSTTPPYQLTAAELEALEEHQKAITARGKNK